MIPFPVIAGLVPAIQRRQAQELVTLDARDPRNKPEDRQARA